MSDFHSWPQIAPNAYRNPNIEKRDSLLVYFRDISTKLDNLISNGNMLQSRSGSLSPQNLGNVTAQAKDAPCSEGVNDMASQHRETYTYRDAQGKKQTIRLNGKDKRDTDEKFQEFLSGLQKVTTSPTIREFVDNVYRPSFMNALSPTTMDNYKQYLDLNIIPFMGDKQMNDVTVADVQRFMYWMATASQRGRKNDLNADSIRRVCGLLSRIYAIAIDMKQAEDNPVKWTLLRNPGKEASHHKAATDDDADYVKRHIPMLEDEQQRLYAALLVYTGMRRQEIMGLRWEDIHLDDGYGEICQTVVYVGSSRSAFVKSPKSKKSKRTFIIPRALAAILEPCQQDYGYVIHGEDIDKPACYSRCQRTSRRVFEALGIKDKYCNHDWRTTYGTQLAEMGTTSKIGGDLMGHADSRMFERIYARSRHEGIMKQRETVEKLSQIRGDMVPA